MIPRIFLDEKVTLYAGDCVEVLAALPEASVDSVVCDPPYHLTNNTGSRSPNPGQYTPIGRPKEPRGGFMGKQWDGGDVAFRVGTWTQILRVLKPGGHLVAFSGTRTYHRMVCAIEDAGFEVRDQIGWAFGSGFPKSHDVSKGIDRAAGAAREVVGQRKTAFGANGFSPDDGWHDHSMKSVIDVTAPATEAAKQWAGYGTALKPAWEPIVLARKPLIGTVAENVLRHGTGAINVDGCRIAGPPSVGGHTSGTYLGIMNDDGWQPKQMPVDRSMSAGRWPANLVHDGSEEVLKAFPETQSGGVGLEISPDQNRTAYGAFNGGERGRAYDANAGSAARFFYTAKADSEDRLGSKHPTVKPLDLMQWLVRLVTPRGGTCLDPFAGTGTTGEAAWREGMRAILIEREEEYLADIARRMELAANPTKRAAVAKTKNKLERPEDLPLFSQSST